MKKWMAAFEAKYPILYFIVVGMGGAAVIILAIDIPAYWIGGTKAQELISPVSVSMSAVWIFIHLISIRRRV